MSATTTAPATASAEPEFTGLDRESMRVFIGLMLGMLVASISQTIVGPAMPRIVAELGGVEHYSWLATAAMLVSAITVPVVGKLSDLYGRRAFYLAGLVIFMLGSVICGLSQNFWMLVAGRAVQGLGMGTIMPLSQTIIGDIIPPRQRGKYQGFMGAVFGVSSVAGPLAGGWITDHLGWRWLFFVAIPFGIAALFVIAAFLHMEHVRREVSVDWLGIGLLAVALVGILLATSFGGSTWAWSDPKIIGLYVVGAIALAAFIWAETRAKEPVLPLRLFRSSIFTLSNIASFFVSMMMFGATIYIPVYAQGVLGVNATNSGLILVPLMLGMIVVGILAGILITRTGSYKWLMIVGTILMGVGYWMLTRLHYGSTQTDLTLAMVVLGIGLGAAQQQYTLVVQNNARRADLGVATSTTQFFRNVGSTVGIAIFGTLMTSSMKDAIPRHMPPEVLKKMQASGQSLNAGAVLDPSALSKLPPAVATGVREGLADALHTTFMAGLPLAACAILATLFIKAVPLRDSVHTSEDAGRELLDTMAQTAHDGDEIVAPLGRTLTPVRTRERILGLQLALLADEAAYADRPTLQRAVAGLADGDLERGRALLRRSARLLTSSDPAVVAKAEDSASQLASLAHRRGGVLSPELRTQIASAASSLGGSGAVDAPEPSVTAGFSAVDLDDLQKASSDLNAAFLIDAQRDSASSAKHAL